MGMSHDYEAAIMEGSNLIRVGTAIFVKETIRNRFNKRMIRTKDNEISKRFKGGRKMGEGLFYKLKT